MRSYFAVGIIVAFTSTAFAQTQRLDSAGDGVSEGGWVVANPAGTSDYFNTRYAAGNTSETVVGIHVAVGDFGTSATGFATAGLFRSNLGVDPTGRTPDLGSAVLTVSGAIVTGQPLHDVQVLGGGSAANEADSHAVVQFPPGDPGLLGVGADTDTNILGGDELGASNPFDSSAFTTNGYSTAGATFDALGDFHLGPAFASSGQALPALRLSTSDPNGSSGGDYRTLTTRQGNAFALSFWGVHNPPAATLWLLFISFAGVPVIPLGSPIPSIPVGDGSTHIRLFSTWPAGAGNITLNFVAASGSPGVIGSVALSNEVTLHSISDPGFECGKKDDGTYEGGWVVAGVAGPSDCFSTPFSSLDCPMQQQISDKQFSVMDFGTGFTAFPRSGVAPPNLALDSAGNTPDMTNPYVDKPFPFPALTFVTTSGQLITQPFIPFTPASDVVMFIGFPAGDPALLGVGADTNSTFIDGRAGWTLDGYNTAANLFGLGNWGIRFN